MRKIYIPLLLWLSPYILPAQMPGQRVIGTGGGKYSNGGLTLSVSIGEVSTQVYKGSNRGTTEGFLQPAVKVSRGAANSLSLDAKLQQEQTLLSWTTTRSAGSGKFELERSFDGQSFTPWRTLEADVQTGEVYFSIDSFPSRQFTYYRVSQVTENGEKLYSSIRAVHRSNISGSRLYPSPARDEVTTAFTCAEAQSMVLDLYDVNGRMLASRVLRCVAGENVFVWNIGGYGSGVYFIRSRNSDIPTMKIVKQ